MGLQSTQINAIHNWCFLAFSMLSHTTLVCSIAQLAAPALVCMQVTDFRPFPHLLEAAPITGLVHPFKPANGSHERIHTCTSVETDLADELP